MAARRKGGRGADLKEEHWRRSEAYLSYREELAERCGLSRSAHSRVTGAGEVAVRLPSDRLNPSQRQSMNGPARVYRLGGPLSRAQYRALPDDLKRLYLKLLRDRHGGTEKQIRRLTGARETFGLCLSRSRGDEEKWRRFLQSREEAETRR